MSTSQPLSNLEPLVHAAAEWQAVFDAVSDLIFITDTDGVVQRCNRNASAAFGGSDAVVGRKIDEVFFGGEPEAKIFRFLHIMDNEIDEDLRFPNLDGWYNVASYPMRFDENRSGIVFIIKDITRRREIEEEKRTSDRELLTLYAVAFRLQYGHGLEKAMADLLFQLHNMLKMEFSFIQLFERGRLRMMSSLGLAAAFEKEMASVGKGSQWCALALAGRPFSGAEPDDRFPAKAKSAGSKMGIRSWCALPLKIGQDVIGVMTVGTLAERSFNDREVFLLSAIAGQLAVLIDNYRLYGEMKEKADELFRSKEELRANLQQVKQANIELGRLNTAKNNFIGIASHELKTPITSILGGAEFLLKYSGLATTPEQQTILASVYEGAGELKKLVEDLLSISRIESQETLSQKRPVNLVQLCREAHDLYLLPLSERRISVQVTGDETPVPVDEAFALMAIKNVLENAIKFTPDGGTITLTGEQVKRAQLKSVTATVRPFYHNFPNNLPVAKQYYQVQVTDTGIGIPADERVRIFDKFHGVGDLAHHSSGRTAFMSKGSGLGLSIVKGIMAVHQGAVWLESREGEGTTFTLLFPMT